jgi:hypothetical protein
MYDNCCHPAFRWWLDSGHRGESQTVTHPLDGPRFKVRRAVDEIQTLRRLEETFQAEAKYEVVRAELGPGTGLYAYRVRVHRAPPLDLDWGVRIGEIAHNLRSALDNLTWQLALLATPTPEPDTQFPIFDVGRIAVPNKSGIGTHDVGFEVRGRSMIRSLSPKHQADVEAWQPYQPGRGDLADHPLLQLTQINNVDKHRVIPVVAARGGSVAYSTWGDVEPTLSGDVVLGPFPVVEDGARILDAAPHVQVSLDVFPVVAFGNSVEEVQGRRVCFILHRAAEQVSEILESFGPEFP